MKEDFLYKKTGVSFRQIELLTLANICYAIALDCFYAANNIAAGGLAGIGTIINSFTPIPIGLTVFVLNIPIVIWGIFVKGKRYVLVSLVGVAMYSLIVDLLAFLPCLTDDMIAAVLCGGILYGSGAALAARAQISAGGTDLLAKLIITLPKFKHFSLGKLYMCIDGTVVVAATIAYGNIEAGIYAVMAIAVCSIVTDKFNSGFNKASMFMIFADKNLDIISEVILKDMGRGVTLLNGTGMYTKTDKDILLVVVKPYEAPLLKSIVHHYDPTAFIILCSASEIIGEGFDDLDLTTTINDEELEKKLEEQFEAELENGQEVEKQ